MENLFGMKEHFKKYKKKNNTRRTNRLYQKGLKSTNRNMDSSNHIKFGGKID